MRTFFILVTIGLLFTSLRGGSETMTIPIIPEPQEWEWQGGLMVLSEEVMIQTDSEFQSEAELLQSNLVALKGVQPEINSLNEGTFKEKNINLVKYVPDSDIARLLENLNLPFTDHMSQEGYVLIIDHHRILITAKTARGIFYGIQSLRFLLKDQAQSKTLPELVIRDWPDFELRGVSDDISRGQVSTLDNFKKNLRFLSEHKMNVYMPYMEDVFQFKSHPSIGKNRGALNADEWRELQDYGEQYHIEIIPIFQTLGHFENILLMEKFRDLAEFPGAASLNVNSGKVYKFLEECLSEIVEVFRSVYFHMGADESWDVGKFATKELAERIGIGKVHADHYNRIYKMLKKYNKKVMMYSDMILRHPSVLDEIPEDVIIFDWHYDLKPHYSSPEFFHQSDRPFIVSPGIQNWLRFFPIMTDGLFNIRELALEGVHHRALGAIAANWGDFGGLNLRELNLYPVAYAAECAWSVHSNDPVIFDSKFYQSFYGSRDPGFAMCTHLLNDMSQEAPWIEMVKHPFYSIDHRLNEIIQRATTLDLFSQKIKKDISQIRLKARYNKDHLDYIGLAAEIFGWYGRLNQSQLNLYRIGSDTSESDRRDRLVSACQTELEQLARGINNISEAYEEIWKRTNRPDNLDRLLALFQRLEKTLRIKNREIGEGDFSFNGALDSPFITHTEANRDSMGLPDLYFRKKFQLRQKPETAWIQLIADSHGRLWINGKEVGEVLARRSLSGWVESERVKGWEISRYLKKGENTVAVEAHNYDGGIASINVWLEIEANQKWQTVLVSDEEWKVNRDYFKNWNRSRFLDEDWIKAISIEKKEEISRPYFEYGLLSRYEF